jgi:hypothetical protein
MNVLYAVLLWIGAVLFLLDTIGVPARINLTAAGLLAWILVPLLMFTDRVI